MTHPLLVLAWLVLAHLVSDFVLQTSAIAMAKGGSGRVAARSDDIAEEHETQHADRLIGHELAVNG